MIRSKNRIVRNLAHRTAQAVGLWLAEGDKRTLSEVTFTNNQPSLIAFFHNVVTKTLRPSLTPRVAVYLPSTDTLYAHPAKSARYRVYFDKRANRPYYIYRISGVTLAKTWHLTVRKICKSKSNYRSILQGFFAGEGNVKEGSHGSRAVRIAQGKPYRFLEKMLDHFRITYYYGGHREYTIFGRANLEKVLALNLMILHPNKHKRFLEMMATFRQRHYQRHALEELVYARLGIPMTTNELASGFGRSMSRLKQVLRRMKARGIVAMYHVNSLCYWVRVDSRTIVISKQKLKILELLGVGQRVHQLAASLGRNDKSVRRRLLELERLGLVGLQNPFWVRKQTEYRVISK